jgi:iron complex outermembrane receptor protein
MNRRNPETGRITAASILTLSGLAAGPLYAQSATKEVLEEVIVTATKRPDGVNVQDTPIAVTAYSGAQLDALHFRTLESLSYSAPNVQMEDIGTVRGIANFSIRGLGINSSIPSIDPTVGVFVDGMYLGINNGVILDTFDLEGVEVLRGPQGVLFGRNVTGGAVLVRTTAPSNELEASGRAAVESGPNYYAMGRASGPVTDKVGAKVALYYNKDEGYFTNGFDGNDDFGQAETKLARAALSFDLTQALDLIVRYEHGDSQGDGPPFQNHVNGRGIGGLFSRDTLDFAVDQTGFYDSVWDQAVAELNWRVPFGNGVITNIFGWRRFENSAFGDVDATPANLLYFGQSTDQKQWSNELRYAGTFGRVDLTTGLYYFDQDLTYVENRLILGGATNLIGGGFQDQQTYAVFSQFDIHLTDQWTLNVGARYSEEKKDARIQTIQRQPQVLPIGFCVYKRGCAGGDFGDSDKWTSFGPRLGAQWKPNDDTMLYGLWARAHRSGGYNMRNTSPTAAPGPFDQETVDTFEVGLKSDLMDGRARLNLALFRNEIGDMQREVNVSDPGRRRTDHQQHGGRHDAGRGTGSAVLACQYADCQCPAWLCRG